jgi:hypothetical protein
MRWTCLLLGILTAAAAWAQGGFVALVSPPRFELKAKPGQVIAELLDISNAETQVANYVISTADWNLNDQGGVVFFTEQPQQGSCRPWVRLERLGLTLGPKALKRFRFEVHVPPGVPPGECRFAIMIAGASEKDLVGTSQLKFPIQGRLGVIVYVAIGGAAPKLEFSGLRISRINNQPTPVAVFRNSGTAHGRPEGILEGVDKNGKALELTVSPSPILPGRTREIPIWAAAPDGSGKSIEYSFPVRIKGVIEWDGGKQAVDTTVP